MASLPAPTDSHFDIEAQRAISQLPPMTPSLEQVEGVKGSETHEMSTIHPGQSEMKSNASQESPLISTGDQNSVVRSTVQSVISEDEGHEGTQSLGVNISNDGGNDDITMQAQDQIQTEARTELERKINTIIGERHAIDPSLEEPQDRPEDRMIGDFEGSANALWTIYGNEAKSHDEARIHTLKDDMDGVLIFAGLFSAALTAFVIDSKQTLKPSPSDQMVYYLQQNVAMLNQISHQISSIAPQISIPSTPPPPFPAFNPLASDIRVNVFWFMALIFSLTSALLAILVQQWVRGYMQAFQHGNPLKSARLRQYLQEGSERWYMPVVAGAVPGLLHVSLFLFFVGLGNSVLNINTAVGVSTIVPIGITTSVYIFTMIAPIIYPQSPYQNSFSGLIWYLIQKLHGRKYKDRDSNGALKYLSPNMAQGQMQLAMEETEARKGRDEQAIRWLVSNMTEDAEMELFAMAIPGSFNGKWGQEVWKNIGDGRRRSHHEPVVGTAAPYPLDARLNSASDDVQGDDVVHELSARIRHLLETCKIRSLFASDELWRQRTRACVETTASLVCCANAKLDWFGYIAWLLAEIGRDQKIRELLAEGKDQSFVMHWTCLSLVALRSDVICNPNVQDIAKTALDSPESEVYNDQKTECFEKARSCLETLFEKLLGDRNPSKEKVERILHLHELEISELERINTEAARSLDSVDQWASNLFNTYLDNATTRHLPGVQSGGRVGIFNDISEGFAVDSKRCREYFECQFILPGQTIKSICSLASIFRNILQGHWDPDVYHETFDRLEVLVGLTGWGNPLQRILWRLQDLGDGGGLGFTVEMFFFSLKALLSRHPYERSHSALYTGTLRALTSDWNKYKHSLGTQKLLLDMITPRDNPVSIFIHRYPAVPAYILDEFLVLLGNVFAGQRGPHIDDAVQQLVNCYNQVRGEEGRAFVAKALEVLTRAGRAPPS